MGASDKLLGKRSTMIRRDGAVLYLGTKPDESDKNWTSNAFQKTGQMAYTQQFSFQVSFYMNNKVFDVVTIDEGKKQ